LQIRHLKTTADTAPQVCVSARQLIDRTLVDIDRLFGGGCLAKGVGYGLLTGGVCCGGGTIRRRSLTRASGECQDQQRTKDKSHERLGFHKGWNLQPIVRNGNVYVNRKMTKKIKEILGLAYFCDSSREQYPYAERVNGSGFSIRASA
jgi:hypothetical protein